MQFGAGSDGPEVFELAEETLDDVAVSEELRAEGRDIDPVRVGLLLAQDNPLIVLAPTLGLEPRAC